MEEIAAFPRRGDERMRAQVWRAWEFPGSADAVECLARAWIEAIGGRVEGGNLQTSQRALDRSVGPRGTGSESCPACGSAHTKVTPPFYGDGWGQRKTCGRDGVIPI